MSCDDGFIAVLSVACLAVGILIGILIMVCYKRVICSVASSTHPQEIDRRASNYSWHGIHTISGNPNVPPMQPFHVGGGSVHRGSAVGDRSDVAELGHSEDSGRRLGLVGARNSAPNVIYTTGDRILRHSVNSTETKSRRNNVNRVSESSTKTAPSDLRGSDPSRMTPPDHEVHNGSGRGGISMQVLSHNKLCETNNTTVNYNIKDSGAKFIPAGFHFPTGDKSKEVIHDNASDIDTTQVKMFAHCPDDVRTTIYEPCHSSRTICLRDKKLVYICKMLDDQGGLLELEKMGISLFVPPGAIPYKQHNLVTLVLNWDLNDNPHMEKKEALVSPVVYCGPHATVFDKPCVLKFRHCAYDTRFARILTSPTDLFDNKSWKEFHQTDELEDQEDDDDDDDDDDVAIPSSQSGVSLNVDECEVKVPHFSLFTCIMRSKRRLLKKWIQVAVFTHDVGSELMHQEIRIYFLNKTPCALQWAIQNEASYGFGLACPDTTFLFRESGENMMIHLSYISDGWEMVARDCEDPMRTVFFEQIWHGACPHTFMCFRKLGHSQRKDSSYSFSGAEMDIGSRFGESQTNAAHPELPGGVKDINESHNECSEINIALRLNQERCENLSVPLNVLAHNIKVKISDTQVKVIDEGCSD